MVKNARERLGIFDPSLTVHVRSFWILTPPHHTTPHSMIQSFVFSFRGVQIRFDLQVQRAHTHSSTKATVK
jgi:hypothetical protein